MKRKKMIVIFSRPLNEEEHEELVELFSAIPCGLKAELEQIAMDIENGKHTKVLRGLLPNAELSLQLMQGKLWGLAAKVWDAFTLEAEDTKRYEFSWLTEDLAMIKAKLGPIMAKLGNLEPSEKHLRDMIKAFSEKHNVDAVVAFTEC